MVTLLNKHWILIGIGILLNILNKTNKTFRSTKSLNVRTLHLENKMFL